MLKYNMLSTSSSVRAGYRNREGPCSHIVMHVHDLLTPLQIQFSLLGKLRLTFFCFLFRSRRSLGGFDSQRLVIETSNVVTRVVLWIYFVFVGNIESKLMLAIPCLTILLLDLTFSHPPSCKLLASSPHSHPLTPSATPSLISPSIIYIYCEEMHTW